MIDGPPPFALAVAVVMGAVVVAGGADEAPAGALAGADGVATEDAVDGSVAGADTPVELEDAIELGAEVELAVVVLELAPSSAVPLFRITTAPPMRTSASRTAPPAATSTPHGVRTGNRVDGTDWLSTVA